jgi:hypothetical protein
MPLPVQAPAVGFHPIHIFAYGSLINAQSLSKTLQRRVMPDDLHPALLDGYQRDWTAKNPIYSEAKHRVVNGLFLDIHKKPGGHVNGVVFDVTPDEFIRLNAREHNYHWTNVGPQLREGQPADCAQSPVLTADFDDAKRYRPGEPNCYVFERYVDTVKTGVQQMGQRFSSVFKKTTQTWQGPTLPGGYRLEPTAENK